MAHTYGTASARTSSTSTTITTATFTPTAGSRCLVLLLVVAGGTNRAGGSPTYNGVTMTQAGSTQKAASSPEASAEIWYVTGTTAAVAATASIPNSGAATVHYELACAVPGSQKSSAYDNAAGGNGTSTNPTCGAMTVAANSITFAILGGGLQAWTQTASGTVISSEDLGAYGAASQYTTSGGGGSQTMSWTGNSDDWGCVSVSFKEINAYSLSCDPGPYATTGSDATFGRAYSLTADPGSYATTGADATVNFGHPMSADAGRRSGTHGGGRELRDHRQ
jgi:hypothetical protein